MAGQRLVGGRRRQEAEDLLHDLSVRTLGPAVEAHSCLNDGGELREDLCGNLHRGVDAQFAELAVGRWDPVVLEAARAAIQRSR